MVVLALVNLVDQADIAILRGVLPILEDEWSLSDLQLGLLGFVFLNAVTTTPAGWLADHTRRTRLIGWTLLSWSGLIIVGLLFLLRARRTVEADAAAILGALVPDVP
jgi:MFS family permease